VRRSLAQNSRTGGATSSSKFVNTPEGSGARADQRVASTPLVMLPPDTLVDHLKSREHAKLV
jgi:hypothetical protein